MTACVFFQTRSFILERVRHISTVIVRVCNPKNQRVHEICDGDVVFGKESTITTVKFKDCNDFLYCVGEISMVLSHLDGYGEKTLIFHPGRQK